MATRCYFPGLLVIGLGIVFSLLPSDAAAARLRQLTEFPVSRIHGMALDDAGGLVFLVSDADPLGTNPHGVPQVFRKSLPGGALQQITNLPDYASPARIDLVGQPQFPGVFGVTVSDDGSLVAFESASDPLGSNPDEGIELFLVDADGSNLTQLTDHADGAGAVVRAVLSGSANRLAFVSDGDLTGENPEGLAQLYVIDPAGSGLAQLTTATTPGSITSLSISDDGQRIVFVDDRDLDGPGPDGTREVYRISADGTGLTPVTNHSVEIGTAALSGDGRVIVYENEGELFSAEFAASGSTYVTDGTSPSVMDDGRNMYYLDNDRIRKIKSTGGSPTDIWTTAEPGAPLVSGSGSHLAFELVDRGLPFVSEPDARELVVTDGAGLLPEQIVEVSEHGSAMSIEMTPDGRWIVFPWGDITAFYDRMDLFLCDTSSEQVSPVTDRAWSVFPSISDDGTTITFSSLTDLVAGSCGGRRIYRVAADGSGLQQIVPALPCTAPGTNADHPTISGDGTTVVAQASGNPSGTDTGGGAELYGVAASGGSVWQVTNDDDSLYKHPRIDRSGTWVVYESASNITGQNPGGHLQVFRARVDGSVVEQITLEDDTSRKPEITADGSEIAYASWADPLGTNPDHSSEVFVHETATGMTEQLTQGAPAAQLRISPNGAFVVFGVSRYLYRLERATGEIVLASAGIFTHSWGGARDRLGYDVDDAGNVAFYGDGDLVGRNRDHSWELWLAEFDVASRFEIDPDAPTVLAWDPLPWAVSYDVIRGDLAALAPGPGGTVDLGDVVCIEDDSDDARTAGDADAAQPSSGQGFFYLYRPDVDALGNQGSWGPATAGAERLPSGGDCGLP